jgi:hypothetical protein
VQKEPGVLMFWFLLQKRKNSMKRNISIMNPQKNNMQKLDPNIMFAEALKATKLPEGTLKEQWFKKAKAALQYASPLALGVSVADFGMLNTTPIDQLSLMQVAVLNNNLESRTPIELEMDIEEYVQFLSETGGVADAYTKQANQIREGISQQLAREAVISKIKKGEGASNMA